MDTAVKPGDDFYKYANGAWIKSATIPPDKSSFGPGQVLTDKTNEQVRGLIQDAASSNPAAGSDAQKVGDYYASYMDEDGIEAKGLTPLAGDLANIAAVSDKTSLSAYLGTTLRRRCRRAQRHQFLHRPHLRRLDHPGLRRPRP